MYGTVMDGYMDLHLEIRGGEVFSVKPVAASQKPGELAPTVSQVLNLNEIVAKAMTSEKIQCLL